MSDKKSTKIKLAEEYATGERSHVGLDGKTHTGMVFEQSDYNAFLAGWDACEKAVYETKEVWARDEK